MDSLPNRPTHLQRKNSLKRRPSIKHTKGSLMRMLKANPLLMFDETAKQELGITDILLKQYGLTEYIQKPLDITSATSFPKLGSSISRTNITNDRQMQSGCDSNIIRKAKSNSSVHKTASQTNISNAKNTTQKLNEVTSTLKKKESADISKRVSLTTMHRKNIISGRNVVAKRRSNSAERYSEKQHLGLVPKINVSLTYSMEDISQAQELGDLQLSPIGQAEFKTPKANNRRSVYAIPSTGRRDKHRLYSSTPGNSDLKSRLNQWLLKRGKSVGSFHHLKCFGIHEPANPVPPAAPIDEENKGNIGLEGNLRRDPSYESLAIIHEEQECKSGTGSANASNCVEIDYQSIARDALHDLYKLIQDGYPHEQCAAWLNIINEKCKNLEEEPEYWECRAALEQCEENIINAVECYRTAIIKGAEVASVDQSLDQLLKKFSLLNIAPIGNEASDKSKVIMEARNVFKSSIIQFAVQERDLRKKEKDKSKCLYVTPVRRSSRLSMHKTTPGVKLCTSLKDMDVGYSDKIQFKKNEYLSVRYN